MDSGGLIRLRFTRDDGLAMFLDILSHTPGQWHIAAGDWYLIDPNKPLPALGVAPRRGHVPI
jgi:hypothetical protein